MRQPSSFAYDPQPFARAQATELVAALSNFAEVQVVATSASCTFFDKGAFCPPLVPEAVPVHDDESEWRGWQKVGDPVLHIELRRWWGCTFGLSSFDLMNNSR